MHRERLLHKGPGELPVVLQHDYIVTQGNFRKIECFQFTFQEGLAGCWTSLILKISCRYIRTSCVHVVRSNSHGVGTYKYNCCRCMYMLWKQS